MNEQYLEVIDFINTTTTEQQMYFIKCIANKIIINVPTNDGINCCSIHEPHYDINLNGIYIDINLTKD